MGVLGEANESPPCPIGIRRRAISSSLRILFLAFLLLRVTSTAQKAKCLRIVNEVQ